MSNHDPKLDAVREVVVKLRTSGMHMIADEIEAVVDCTEHRFAVRKSASRVQR